MDPRLLAALVTTSTLAFALALPSLLYLGRARTYGGWLVGVFTCWALGLLFFFVADWSSLSVHLRWFLLAHLTFGTACSFRRLRHSAREPVRFVWLRRSATVVVGAIGLAATSLVIELFRPDEALSVPLAWPLSHPRAYVVQGGASLLENHHVEVAAQTRALDVVALDRWGRRSHGWFSKHITDYEIYGALVSSPCAGEVVLLRSGEPQRPAHDPPLVRRIAGNYVMLACEGREVTVMLAHLQSELLVSEGQRVPLGTPLGKVGNSGNSSEPHLHVHAVAGRVLNADEMLGNARPGVAMSFPSAGGILERGDIAR